jgi:hypothetical protein
MRKPLHTKLWLVHLPWKTQTKVYIGEQYYTILNSLRMWSKNGHS